MKTPWNQPLPETLVCHEVVGLLANLSRDVVRKKAEWLESCSEAYLPKVIYQHVQKDGLNVNSTVALWIRDHVELREHPMKTEFVVNGKVKSTFEINFKLNEKEAA